MILSWLRERRRRKFLAAPFPAAWLPYLERNVAHYRYLEPPEQARLRDSLRVFIAEKNWEGCAGLQLTEEMQVTIAAQACLIALGLEGDPFRKVLSILVYPTGYVVPKEQRLGDWSIRGGEDRRLGEAHYRGPVILSWADVRRDSRHPGRGRNLVWHEFAHQLDMLDSDVNGTPLLTDAELRRRWGEIMTAEYEALVSATEEGRETLLDPYGAQDAAEFFAIVTECFFDRPWDPQIEHAELYDLLRDYYRQDPAARMPAYE